MNCPKCNAHINETDERCPYCNTYNEKYKEPEPEKPAEPAAPVSESAPQVIHIYHDEPKKKRRFKIPVFRLVFLSFVVLIVIVMIRVACT